MRRLLVASLMLGTILVGCDTTEPQEEPEPHFDMTLGPPVEATVEGAAALGDGTSFEQGNLFTFSLPRFGHTITAVQLFGENGAVSHDLSFLYVAEEGLAPGTYEVNMPFDCRPAEDAGCSQHPSEIDSLFVASYGRQTSDSLFSYGQLEGTVTIETAQEDLVSGEFDLSATQEVAVAHDDLKAFIDSLRSGDSEPGRPPFEARELGVPLSIEGTFEAAPGDFSDSVSHLNWVGSGQQVEF